MSQQHSNISQQSSLIEQPERLGKIFRDLRTSRQMTVAQLAGEAGLSNGYISLIESGKRSPHWSTLMRLAQILDTSLGEILRRWDDQSVAMEDEEDERNQDEGVGKRIDPTLYHSRTPLLLAGSLPDEWGQVAERDSVGYSWILTASGPEGRGKGETIRFRIPPRTPWTPEMIRYPAWATLISLEGTILVELGRKERDEFMLHEGEVMQFDGNRPHRLRNFQERAIEGLLILHPEGI